MSRQINLLVQERLAPELSALRVLIGLGAILVAFLGYGAYGWIETTRSGDTVVQSSAQIAAERAALQALEQKLGARPKLADLLAQIEALKMQAGESQEIVNLLRGGGGANSEGYSGHLTALARASEEGLWLTGVKISNEGKSVSLAGHALRHESVLRYAQRLNEQFSRYGVRFSSLELVPEVLKLEFVKREAGKEGASGAALPYFAFKLF